MNDQMQKELLQRLDALAAKIGVSAEHLWRVLVAQAGVEAIYKTLWLVVGVVFLYLSIKGWRFALKVIVEGKESPAVLWAGILPSVVCLFSLTSGSNVLTCLVNPEYWALEQLLKMLQT